MRKVDDGEKEEKEKKKEKSFLVPTYAVASRPPENIRKCPYIYFV